ncbi:PAS domain S-box protein [Pendulispora rubella]|uniref:PAS domain S-box protein n=1 Tax=Pendulispora rubella TaxID=2741070 RepID=UPI00374E1E30
MASARWSSRWHARFEAEGWRVRKDGTRLWANVVITALRDESGTLVGFAKMTRDLTERVRRKTIAWNWRVFKKRVG